jgi:hypothetical protein
MTTPQIDDTDIDTFVAQWLTQLNPALSAEKRADVVHDFVVGLLKLTEPDKSDLWVVEFARRVRARALWLKT